MSGSLYNATKRHCSSHQPPKSNYNYVLMSVFSALLLISQNKDILFLDMWGCIWGDNPMGLILFCLIGTAFPTSRHSLLVLNYAL